MPETERLILRRYRKEDLLDLYEYLSDEEVVRFEPYRPMDMPRKAAKRSSKKPFQRVFTESTQNAIPAILPPGGCWKP